MRPSSSKWAVPSALLALLALGVPSTGHAGSSDLGASCVVFADGSGNCTGTMIGFRQSGDPAAYAMFAVDSAGNHVFYGKVNGVTASCNATNVYPGVLNLWSNAISSPWFSIRWDAQGVCSSLMLRNTSTAY